MPDWVLVDTLIVLAYGLQHSLLTTKTAVAWFGAVLPVYLWNILYSGVSVATLILGFKSTACDQWLRMSVLARLEGNAKLADAIARTQFVHKLIYQKYVVREVNGKRELSVRKQSRLPLAA